jgi:hypothetical protein
MDFSKSMTPLIMNPLELKGQRNPFRSGSTLTPFMPGMKMNPEQPMFD